jgi:lysozyme
MNDFKKSALALSLTAFIALASWESYRETPYKDVGGVWTDGFGNTNNVVPNKKVSVPKALKQLGDNAIVAERAVKQCITKPMTQNQYDSFVLFTYNVGGGAFCKSTLVKKFNAGDSVGACNELAKWVYVNGKKVEGLANRREDERKICLS